MTVVDFSKQLNGLKKQQKWDEALAYFREHRMEFPAEQIGKNYYLVASMLTVLRKKGYVDEAFKFVRMFDVRIGNDTDGMVLNAYGWLLFNKYRHDREAGRFNAFAFLQLATPLMREIMRRNDPFFDTLIHLLFDIVTKTEKKKKPVNYRFLNDFCDLFKPKRLRTEPETMEVERKGRRQMTELASDREKWYAIKTKALLELGEAETCLELSREALGSFERFHHQNEVWFARRIALSYKMLGRIDRAIEELEAIRRKKNDWFIKRELAELYHEMGDEERAFSLAMEAMNDFGDIEYKIGLMELVATLLEHRGERELAYRHLWLVKTIRERERWKVSEDLMMRLDSLGIEPPTQGEGQLQKELREYWKRCMPQKFYQKGDEKSKSGKIRKILHQNEQGVDGFIETEDGDYYFSLPTTVSISSKLKEGTSVMFEGGETERGKRARKIKIINKT